MIRHELKVQNEFTLWALSNGWHLDVFDSAILRKVKKGRYPIPLGCPDMIGFSPEGILVYLELKRKGKAGTCRHSQYLFLRHRIEKGCFGLVTDSPEHFLSVYRQWCDMDRKEGISFLLSKLPVNLLLNGRMVLAPA